jgi:hypothetical protein
MLKEVAKKATEKAKIEAETKRKNDEVIANYQKEAQLAVEREREAAKKRERELMEQLAAAKKKNESEEMQNTMKRSRMDEFSSTMVSNLHDRCVGYAGTSSIPALGHLQHQYHPTYYPPEIHFPSRSAEGIFQGPTMHQNQLVHTTHGAPISHYPGSVKMVAHSSLPIHDNNHQQQAVGNPSIAAKLHRLEIHEAKQRLARVVALQQHSHAQAVADAEANVTFLTREHVISGYDQF